MSGFTGFIDSKIKDNGDVIEEMIFRIKHRGPNYEDYFINEGIFF